MSVLRRLWRRPDYCFFFSDQELQAIAARGAEYLSAEPFPHAVMDDFLPRWVADKLLAEFPPARQLPFAESAGENRQGKRFSREEDLSDFTRQVLYHLNSGVFLRAIETLAGIPGLIPDPEIGGSLRHFERGGRLGVHADFNYHEHLRVDRRLNLILYLNRGWLSDWGGELELWDPDMTRCVRRIAPEFNRAVIFTTNDRTPHGFPEPLLCPEGETRKSLQLYYYTAGRPPSEQSAPHGTLFHARRS